MHLSETGAHGRTNDGQVFRVSRVIKHPQFSMQHLRHDVALLELSSAVKLGGKINTVCLPKHGSRVSQGTTCYVTGNNLKWLDFKVVLIKQNLQRSLLMTAVINLIIQSKPTYNNAHFSKLASKGTFIIAFTGKLGS